ncbi:MAG TPA: phenylalanine--tRNA ligase beta subunit-related protein, partial [Leptolinea sp.]
MTAFQYDAAICKSFPLISGGIILGHNLQNKPSSPQVMQLFRDEQLKVLEKLGTTPLSELPTLAGWRAAFRQFGVDPTGYRSAAEALLRRLTKKGDIPSINTLVDICNLTSIRYGLPVAAIDTRQVTGVITVRFACGDENF